MSVTPTLSPAPTRVRRRARDRDRASLSKNTHLNEMRKRKRDFFSRIYYGRFLTVVLLPLAAVLYVFLGQTDGSPRTSTVVFLFCYLHWTLLAFTAGYHKCFSHNAFRPRYRIVHVYFAVFGASVGLGPIRWWAALHRAHHQFTDSTERDPYSIKRGFMWAHWGWLIRKPKSLAFYDDFIEQEFPMASEPADLGRKRGGNAAENDENAHTTALDSEDTVSDADDADLDLDDPLSGYEAAISDPSAAYAALDAANAAYTAQVQALVRWQDTHYLLFFCILTVLIPVAVSVFLCGDSALNGLIYPGILRMFLCQQPVLATESVCHSRWPLAIPLQPFNDKNLARNCHNPVVSLLTYGQGHQNYHHEFPHDYRGSHLFFSFDPTKWFIFLMLVLGLVDELHRTPKDVIAQLRTQQRQEIIDRMRRQLNWGTPISKLPLITPQELRLIVSLPLHQGRNYIVIQNIIHDVTPFMEQHPGGVSVLKASHGKDATKAFYGGVYRHLAAAVNLLSTMRIGVLDVGDQEGVWNRVAVEEGEVQDSRRGDKQYRTAEAA